MTKTLFDKAQRMAFGVHNTIKNSLRDQRLFTSIDEVKGYVACPTPKCGRHDAWKITGVSEITCGYCDETYYNYGVLGMIHKPKEIPIEG